MRFSLVVCLFAITTIVFAQINTDDTSLFREVENAVDESTEEDAYRILKGLQDMSDESRENEGIEDIIDNDDEEEEEEEEEEDDDFSSNFPEFQNKETSEFFEHLPQPPTDNQNNEMKQQEDEEEHIEEDEEEDEGEEGEEEEEEPKEQPNPFQNDQFIPWKRPETMIKSDNTFYQDINFRETTITKPSLFKTWHILVVFLVAIGLYYRQSRKSHSAESTSWNNNEKDYLPLHNNSSKLL
ncbi:uncharacterized protein B0P05DRAFT_591322 [Gilbertella persicaria]|uniref:uncharacterized protein n=1 Tax=Gilbertella persicaria TaxID=101096 RepID=UPI00221E74B3|nr:uncharacterized protein B0P05DRAFT_591322 [Gilbertella persicaria]KAI8056528.1 hypothetical protein B0P05DRAFT_591322 [Gilbertella persicaria]